MDDYDGIEIICECAGRCGMLSIERYEEDMWGIQYYIPPIYSHIVGWKETIKMIWTLLRGKKYWYYDVILNKKQMEKLRTYLDRKYVDE